MTVSFILQKTVAAWWSSCFDARLQIPLKMMQKTTANWLKTAVLIDCIPLLIVRRINLPKRTQTFLGSLEVCMAPNAAIPPKLSPIANETVLPVEYLIILITHKQKNKFKSLLIRLCLERIETLFVPSYVTLGYYNLLSWHTEIKKNK